MKIISIYKIICILTVLLYSCQNSNEYSGNKIQNSVRKTHILSDNWKFQIDIRDIGEKGKWFDLDNYNWATVKVPQAWNGIDQALWQYQGIGWYSTTIKPEHFNPSGKVIIHFGRVMIFSKIWINGEFVGENNVGYLPFTFDITEYLKPGEDNHLVMRVDNRPRIEWIPASEQIEWIQYGGILEPVKIISSSHLYINDIIVRTVPENKGAQIDCDIEISNETNNDEELELNVAIALESEVIRKIQTVQCKSNGIENVNISFDLEKAELWSPDTPVLYTINAQLSNKNEKIDDYADRFGIREVRAEGTSILLNGEPVIIKGTHRYDDYGKYGPTPPVQVIRDELELMKSIGINTIRTHYPASPEVLDLYDEYGFLMFEEIPINWWGQDWFKGMRSIGGVKEQSLDILEQAKSFLTEMIARDKNHPCIIAWSMANESATDNEIGITVMRELLKLSKVLDPTRLATFVAADNPLKHLGFDEADIVCFNRYVICDYINQLDSVAYMALSKDLQLYRNTFPDQPIVITEFGRQGIKGLRGDNFYTEDYQAAYVESIWKAIEENPTISGGILWSWADYYHQLNFTLRTSYNFYGVSTASYGPYGVVTRDGEPKKSLASLARMYGGTVPEK